MAGGGSEAEPCFEQQLAFQDACYEAVKLQRTFRSAQGWCERGGGHLAFILRQETQEFLQKSLAAGRDWWIGLAPWKENLTQERTIAEGGLAWLDGTKLSYSNWSPAHRLPATAECAFIAKNSAYHWLSTPNCSQELYFICEFESGRTLACDHVNATLQCESGKVIQIDNSFYGRKTLSYCSSETASPPETQECGWVDVREQVAGDCHGLQVCQASADPTSFGDPCPSLGSYLVVEYHCKEGLRLLVDDLYSLLENVTISQQWLLHPYSGNLTCTLSTGDGFVIDPYNPLHKVTHRYRAAGLFTISIECSTSEWNVAAQKTISIQEPIGDLGTLKCANGNQSADVNNCRALYGEPLWIQLEVEEGTNVTYVLSAGTAVLHTCTVLSGNIPQNVTIESAAQHLIGPGTHQLKILAKNNVTIREVSQNITVDLVEPIVGLEAVLNSAVLELGKDLTVNISVSLGAPIQLQFEFIGPNGTFSETIESPDGKLGAYSIPMNSEGIFQVKGEAVNAFSSMSFNAGNITVKANSSILIERDVDDAIDEAPSHEIKAGARLSPVESRGSEENQISHQKDTLQAIIHGSAFQVVDPFTKLVLRGKQSEDRDKTDKRALIFQWSCEDTLLKVTCSECTTSLTYNWYRVSTSNQEMNRHSACVSQKQNGVLKIFTLMKENTNVLILTSEELAKITPVLKVRAVGVSENGDYRYRDHTISMVPPPPVASCAISPEEGSTVTTTFSINCKVNCNSDQPCSLSDLKYCFYVKPNIALHCGSESILPSVYLPHGDSDNSDQLTITVIVSNSADTFTSVTVNATVHKFSNTDSKKDLQTILSESIQDMSETNSSLLIQLFESVSSVLNQEINTGDTGSLTLDDRKQLREMMLLNMFTVDVISFHTVLEVSEVLKQITHRPEELNAKAQLQANTILLNMAKSLLTLTVADDKDYDKRTIAANSLFRTVNDLLEASEGNEMQSNLGADQQREVLENLLSTIEHLQNALLMEKQAEDEPIILMAPSITMFLQRLSADGEEGHSIIIPNSTAASFTLPPLSALKLKSGIDTVDVRMVSFSVNPFTWANKSEVSGTVGGLTLTLVNGTVQPINELSEDIEIILPRLEVAHENQTELKLRGNQVVVKVNVTSENATLLLHLEPEQDISLLLYLGFESEANETSPHRSTQLPYVQYAGAARYTWILPPTDLTYGIGTYYITVQPDLNSSDVHNMTLAFTSFATQCVYWDEISSNWSTSGCRVGPLTTPTSTQCLCNHLTFFSSSFFVMPNTVDVSKTLELFATFSNNPVVVMTVACIFALYLLAVIWARRKDQQDVAKVKMTVLADNDPFAQYRYLVTVYTGHRRGAFTTAEVTITLYGSEGESDPHHLTDSEKPVFESGGVDVFLLATLFPLGDLQSIRMWHDNSGSSPAWYVNRVTVHDLETDQRWCFLCNSWLAIDVGECLLDKTFSVATETDLKRFSNLFFMKTAKDFRDGHIWYSVFSCPPRSSFTRVQRVSCCFSLLLCTMLTSIIFWGIPKDPAQQKMDLGKIEFTWQEVVIGFESSLLMFPINLLIVQIFRNIRPKSKGKETQRKQGKHGRISPSSSTPSSSPPSCSLTPEAVIKDIQRIANSLTKTLKNPLPTFEKDCIKTTDINILLALVEKIICEQNKTDREFYNENHKKAETLILSLGSVNLQENPTNSDTERGLNEKQRRSDHNHYLYLQLQHVEKELEYLGPASFQSPHSYTQAVCQVHNMKDFLESTIPCSNSASDRFSPTPSLSGNSKKEGVCAKGLPWWFVFVGWFLVAATSGVSAFFTMLYGLSYGKDNSIKWLISMSISFFESLLITQPLKVLGFAAFFALVLKKVDEEEVEDGPINNSLSTTVGDPSALLATRRDSSSSVYQPPPPNDVEKMKKDSIKEQKVFGLIREILAYLGFLWMLLLVAYGQRDPNSYYLNKAIGNSFSHGFGDVLSYSDFFKWANNTLISNLFGSYPGFVTDGNSNLVGSARIRQLRVKRSSCPVPAKLRNSMTECHTQYSLSNEDLSDYGLHWNTSASQNSSDLDSVWQYQSQSELRSFPIWGKLAMYRGGGYIAELGTDAQDAYRILQYLFQNTWLDIYTRSIFVEFTVYNANVNLFCIATLVLESNAVGAFFTHIDLKSVRLYQYTDGLHIFVIAAEVAYFLFLIYYMVIQGKLLKAQKWGYFKSKWNLLEMAIIMISWSAFSVFIKRTLLGKRDIDHYHNHREGFVSFYETAMADAVMGYLIAFLVLLATVKLWHLLRLNPKLNMITSTIRRAWGDISGFLTVMIIMFVAYSIATNLMFGWSMSSYKTILDAAETMVSLQLGIFNYEEVLDYSPILGSFLIGSCIIFMTFVVLNLFISVILVAFSEEQKNYKASEEEEIVDLMLMKLFSFFGIKYSKDTCQSGG
ncbi:polycystic kidney disease protein 1-like 2 [Callorhinchus milii]|uniref:polycystic kidney disease protein 1-like 2 n=1 Tax=Callorhinchus milii TaxID=7868 RepID=UPI001C3F57BA|nr:polycystic kidney disease protein 1-like 2 [Callorhinchus milii]